MLLHSHFKVLFPIPPCPKDLAQAACREDLCQITFIDKWKPPALRLGETFWLWDRLDKDLWGSIPALTITAAPVPVLQRAVMTGAARNFSWLRTSEPVEAKYEDGAPEITLPCVVALMNIRWTKPLKHSCAMHLTRSSIAVPWHDEEQHWELLATKKEAKKRWPSTWNGACHNCLVKWWGGCVWNESYGK